MNNSKLFYLLVLVVLVSWYFIKKKKEYSIIMYILPYNFQGVLYDVGSSKFPDSDIVNDTLFIYYDEKGMSKYNYNGWAKRPTRSFFCYKDTINGSYINLNTKMATRSTFFNSMNGTCEGFSYFSFIFTTDGRSENIERLMKEQEQTDSIICTELYQEFMELPD